MAFTTDHGRLPFDIVKALHAIGQSIYDGFTRYTERNARTVEINRLNQLSDDELAQMGLTRDKIVFHVFRDRFYL